MEATKIDENVTEVWADPSATASHGRLAYVEGVIARRRQALDDEGVGAKIKGEAFRVHLCGDVAGLVDDDVCRAVLELIARHGERTNVVALVYASVETATVAFSPSAVLTHALADGRTYRLVEPTGAPGISETNGARAADALLRAARLTVGAEPHEVQVALDRALSGDSRSARAALAAALIAAAALVVGRRDEADGGAGE